MEKSLLCTIIVLCAVTKDVVSRIPSSSFINEGNKIVGGYNVTIQQHPYQAYLLLLQDDGKNYQCGGSIITRNHILTAAHCLSGTRRVTARLGSTYANSGGTQYTSYIFRSHPRYNSRTFDYDIGYVRFSTLNIDGINTRIVYLASNGTSVEPGTILTVSGWGATSEDGNVSQNLMAVQVPVVSNMQCRRSYGTITSRMICAGVPEGGKDSCGGDSGGPGVTNDGIQVAIVSNGIGCARPGIPGVYTNVARLREWIRRNTGA